MAFNTFPTSSPWPPLELANDLNDNFSKTAEVSLSTSPTDGSLLAYDASSGLFVDQIVTYTIEELTDVNLSTNPNDGDLLTYDASSDTWVNSVITITLEELSNVVISSSPADGSSLVYDASSDTWVDGDQTGANSLGGLTDVILSTSPTDGDVLTYDASSDTWINATGGGGGGGGSAGYFKGENGAVGNNAGDIFRINEKTLNTDVTIGATENASATGPLSVATGVTLTVTSGGTLAII